ncbi:hypothetical protein [Heyndrickxia shackletonii]|uniref:hypothetical protein n=1 Tax=Heyndrickxia shackletonii TaxID=157838 RepID=UPI0006EC280C|nr:hypothetical protein [Heyndrickxia shackletonii]NEZ00125.1 hypothetical protein [Heyndrickxia shackletonii]
MRYFFSVIIVVFFLMGCSSSTSWAFEFIRYNDVNYKVTNEEIKSKNLGEKIGEVKYYLKKEQDGKDMSSNIYPKGTEFYRINGIDKSDAIAVKDDNGKIIKLVADK